MRSDIISAALQIRDDLSKGGVPEKITGEKERGFYFFLFQRLMNEIPSVGEFMPGKDQRDILLGAVAPDDGTTIAGKAPAPDGG